MEIRVRKGLSRSGSSALFCRTTCIPLGMVLRWLDGARKVHHVVALLPCSVELLVTRMWDSGWGWVLHGEKYRGYGIAYVGAGTTETLNGC